MPSFDETLNLKVSNTIHSDGNKYYVFQTDSGVLFYFSHERSNHSNQRLFVKRNGVETHATIPGKILMSDGCNAITKGNALYFVIEGEYDDYGRKVLQVYKAENCPSGEITVLELRTIDYDEKLLGNGLCSIRRNGQSFLYRLFDDPIKDAITFNDSGHYRYLRGVHNGRAVFLTTNTERETHYGQQLILSTKDNEINIATSNPQKTHIYAQDSSSFIYLVLERFLFVLDMEANRVMPRLNIGDHVESIVGICKGTISVMCANFSSVSYVKTAELPYGYFDCGFRIGVKKMADRLDKVEKVQKIMQMEEIMQIKTELEIRLETAQNEWSKEKEELIKRNKELEEKFREQGTNHSPIAQDEINIKLVAENEQLKMEMKKVNASLIQSKIWALQSAKNILKFTEMENLAKPLVCIQLEDGSMMYFDNAKPFELFIMQDLIRVNADLKLLDGEYDCTFRGTIGTNAYFNTVRGKLIKFFKATVDDGAIKLEQINEIKTSDLSLFKNEPLYFVERSKEWEVYKYDQTYTECEGEKFDISEIDLLSKYERHYHRGVLYLFRDTATAKVETVNEKVVKVEGPLLEDASFYAPHNSKSIYILNHEQNVLIILNTEDLTLSQHCYEPTVCSNNHSIVGIHNGVLTMAFDGVWGRHLSTTQLPQSE